jgi:starch synthase
MTEVKFFHQTRGDCENWNVDYVFVDHPCYHRPEGLYYNVKEGREYDDNLFRFALFSLAALEVPKLSLPTNLSITGLSRCYKPYGEKVVFLANDWQAGLLPVYLVHRHRPRGEYIHARCIFIVHNFGYQGVYPLNLAVEDLGLDSHRAKNDLSYIYPNGGHVLNLSKAALMTADRILTVSPGYASEMKTDDGGFGLQNVVRMRESIFAGILNGIDLHHWNPRTDPLLAARYGPTTDFLSARAACKKQLQERLNLKVDPDIAVVSFVGRLVQQKGIDIILGAVDWLMADTGNRVTGRVQLILMGHGDACHAEGLRSSEHKYKGLVCGYVGFHPDIEHMIYGGSDLFLMPSRYEPCGLTQMYAMHYGCIPVVTLCGGLKDSVVTEPPEEATGFGIFPLTVNKFKEVTYNALDTFYHKREEFQAMQFRGIVEDFSWSRALDQYEQHIDLTFEDQHCSSTAKY